MPRGQTELKIPRRAVVARARPRPGRFAAPALADAASSTQRIVGSITGAIAERRLMPGTKLSEQKIADIFKVSRTLGAPGAEPAEQRPPGAARTGARRLRGHAQRENNLRLETHGADLAQILKGAAA